MTSGPIQKVMSLIEDEGDPKHMTKTQWIDFLESIMYECETRAEAAREELAENG